MPANSDFFAERDPQAVLKHGVLTRYAHYFAGRAGAAAQGRVAFIDGYAGEGRYEDGNPGSPLLLASEASRLAMLGRSVKLALVENDDERREKLSNSLVEYSVEADQLLGGSVEDVVDELLDRYARHAILLFVDPFGLAINHQTLERVLRRSSQGQPIDVLYHFSLSSLARMGRAGLDGSENALKNAAQIEDALGPIEWRNAFQGADSHGTSTTAAIDVAREFGAAMFKATGVRNIAVPVRQRPHHLPRYLLMLFSKNAQAHWDFADQASAAHVDWLHHCDVEDFESYMQLQEQTGQFTIFQEEAPLREDIDGSLTKQSASYFDSYLPTLLHEAGPFLPIDNIEKTYGEMFGRARVTHLRTAFKRLFADKKIDNSGVHNFWERTTNSIE